MVDKNDALLREVDEELRREQLEKFWKKNSGYVFAGAAAIVLAVGGYKFLEARRIAAAESAGARYEAALEQLKDGKADDANKAFSEMTKSGSAGYATLARLQVAGAHLKAGRNAEALAAFDEVVKAGADPVLTNFAKLQAAALRLGEADFTEMQNRLNELADDKSPWRSNARELLGLAALKAGKTDEARKLFEQIMGDRNAPPNTLERIRIALGNIISAELAKPAPAATDAPKADAPKDAQKK